MRDSVSDSPLFTDAFPFLDDVLALPVEDIDATPTWYCEKFGVTEISRKNEPVPTVILERDGTQDWILDQWRRCVQRWGCDSGIGY